MGIYMTHSDILMMDRFTYLHGYQHHDEKAYCQCGETAENKLCTDCIDKAILDNETRIAYINSDQEFIRDWMEYTGDLVSTSYEPTEKEMELVKNEHEADQESLCLTAKWINEDRSHFEDWVYEGKGGILHE